MIKKRKKIHHKKSLEIILFKKMFPSTKLFINNNFNDRYSDIIWHYFSIHMKYNKKHRFRYNNKIKQEKKEKDAPIMMILS